MWSMSSHSLGSDPTSALADPDSNDYVNNDTDEIDDLDEFLIFQIEQHGVDKFDKIAQEFSSLADDIEDPVLKEAALEQYSYENLQKRWQILKKRGEKGVMEKVVDGKSSSSGVAEISDVIDSTLGLADSSNLVPRESSSSSSKESNPVSDSEIYTMVNEQEITMPISTKSSTTVSTSNNKIPDGDEADNEYLANQSDLNESFNDSETGSDATVPSISSEGGAAASNTSSRSTRPDINCTSLSNSSLAASDQELNTSASDNNILTSDSDTDNHSNNLNQQLQSQSSSDPFSNADGRVDELLRDETLRLFGSDKLKDIFGKKPKTSKEFNPHFPSFGSILLSAGIDPHNPIDGCMDMTVPENLKPVFKELKDNLDKGFNYADPHNKYTVKSSEEANCLLKGLPIPKKTEQNDNDSSETESDKNKNQILELANSSESDTDSQLDSLPNPLDKYKDDVFNDKTSSFAANLKKSFNVTDTESATNIKAKSKGIFSKKELPSTNANSGSSSSSSSSKNPQEEYNKLKEQLGADLLRVQHAVKNKESGFMEIDKAEDLSDSKNTNHTSQTDDDDEDFDMARKRIKEAQMMLAKDFQRKESCGLLPQRNGFKPKPRTQSTPYDTLNDSTLQDAKNLKISDSTLKRAQQTLLRSNKDSLANDPLASLKQALSEAPNAEQDGYDGYQDLSDKSRQMVDNIEDYLNDPSGRGKPKISENRTGGGLKGGSNQNSSSGAVLPFSGLLGNRPSRGGRPGSSGVTKLPSLQQLEQEEAEFNKEFGALMNQNSNDSSESSESNKKKLQKEKELKQQQQQLQDKERKESAKSSSSLLAKGFLKQSKINEKEKAKSQTVSQSELEADKENLIGTTDLEKLESFMNEISKNEKCSIEEIDSDEGEEGESGTDVDGQSESSRGFNEASDALSALNVGTKYDGIIGDGGKEDQTLNRPFEDIMLGGGGIFSGSSTRTSSKEISNSTNSQYEIPSSKLNSHPTLQKLHILKGNVNNSHLLKESTNSNGTLNGNRVYGAESEKLRQERRKLEDEEKKKNVAETERIRNMMEDRLKGSSLDQIMEQSEKVKSYLAEKEEEIRARDAKGDGGGVLIHRVNRGERDMEAMQQQMLKKKEQEQQGKTQSLLQYSDSYLASKEAGKNGAGKLKSKDKQSENQQSSSSELEETNSNQDSSSSMPTFKELTFNEFNFLVEKRYNFPLVHPAATTGSVLSFGPSGFASESELHVDPKYHDVDMYALPFTTDENSPLPSGKTMQLLHLVGKAKVAFLIDGYSLNQEYKGLASNSESSHIDIQQINTTILYLIFCIPNPIHENLEPSEIATLTKESNFIRLSKEEYMPLLGKGSDSRILSYGAHLVGNDVSGSSDCYADSGYGAVHSDQEIVKTGSFYDGNNSCILVLKRPEFLEMLIRGALVKGLYVSGLRTVYPTTTDINNCPSILKQHLVASDSESDSTSDTSNSNSNPSCPNFIIAFRGPSCLEVMRDIIGPSPEIARKTDPQSLNARYGGIEGVSVASPPVKGLVDLVWAFGGRLSEATPEGVGSSDSDGYLKEVLVKYAKGKIYNKSTANSTKLNGQILVHGYHVFREQTFSAGIVKCLSAKELIMDKLPLILRHAGRILSMNPQKKEAQVIQYQQTGSNNQKSSGDSNSGGCKSTFVLTGVREGGVSLLQSLNIFDTTRFATTVGSTSGDGTNSNSTISYSDSVITMDSYGMKIKPLSRESFQPYVGSEKSKFKEPVEICVSFLPLVHGDDLKYILDPLSVLNSDESDCAEDENSSNTGYGEGIELINLRVIDMSQVVGLNQGTEYFLRSPILDEKAKSGLCLFMAFRGESAIERVGEWITKKTRAVYGGRLGRWKFTKNSEESYNYYQVFFGLRSFFGPSSILPSRSYTDLRNLQRYSFTLKALQSRNLILSSDTNGKLKTSLSNYNTASVSNLRSTCNVEPDKLFYGDSKANEVSASHLEVNDITADDKSSSTFALIERGHLAKTLNTLTMTSNQSKSISSSSGAGSSSTAAGLKFNIVNIVSFIIKLGGESEVPEKLRQIREIIWDQDVEDGFLKGEDRDSYMDWSKCGVASSSTSTSTSSSTSGSSSSSTSYYIVQLELTSKTAAPGTSACKTLAQLCGHGDPNENIKTNRVSLRRGKGGRVWNGVRCTSSAESVKKVADILGVKVGNEESTVVSGSESFSSSPNDGLSAEVPMVGGDTDTLISSSLQRNQIARRFCGDISINNGSSLNKPSNPDSEIQQLLSLIESVESVQSEGHVPAGSRSASLIGLSPLQLSAQTLQLSLLRTTTAKPVSSSKSSNTSNSISYNVASNGRWIFTVLSDKDELAVRNVYNEINKNFSVKDKTTVSKILTSNEGDDRDRWFF